MKNMFSVLLFAASALLSACGGGDAPPPDATVKLTAQKQSVEMLPGQMNVPVATMSVSVRDPGAFVAVSEIEIGDKALAEQVNVISFFLRSGSAPSGIPGVSVKVTPKGRTSVSFDQPWYFYGESQYDVYISLRNNTQSGQLQFAVGEVVNRDAGVRISSFGSATVAVKEKAGYSIPKLETASTNMSTVAAGQSATRTITLPCPEGNVVNCTYFSTSLVTSGVVTEVTAHVNGYAVPVVGDCYAYSDSYYSCSYGVDWNLVPGQSVVIAFVNTATVPDNWMFAYWTGVRMGADTWVAPTLPTACELMITAGSCKG